MSDQKLQNYAHLAEIVGALAIIVSLIFVGLEIRQSNTLVSTESLLNGTQIWVSQYSASFGSEESTAFFRRAANNYQELNQDEKGLFFSRVMGFVAAFDNIYNQYTAGALREDVFYSIALDYYGLISMPGVQSVLQDNVPELPRYLRDYSVNEMLIGEEDRIGRSFEFLSEK